MISYDRWTHKKSQGWFLFLYFLFHLFYENFK
jgi:hypothetical protein